MILNGYGFGTSDSSSSEEKKWEAVAQAQATSDQILEVSLKKSCENLFIMLYLPKVSEVKNLKISYKFSQSGDSNEDEYTVFYGEGYYTEGFTLYRVELVCGMSQTRYSDTNTSLNSQPIMVTYHDQINSGNTQCTGISKLEICGVDSSGNECTIPSGSAVEIYGK